MIDAHKLLSLEIGLSHLRYMTHQIYIDDDDDDDSLSLSFTCFFEIHDDTDVRQEKN